MIDYGHFSFATPPRSGSTWFIGAMAQAGLQEASKAYVHVPWPRGTRGNGHLRVALVRDPCSWLASYYASIYPGCVGVPEVDALRRCTREACPTFTEFIDAYLQHLPGQVGRVWDAYEADSFIRTSELAAATGELLAMVGLGRTAQAAAMALPAQCTTHRYHLQRMPRPQQAAVLAAEADFCERFEFDPVPLL